MKNKKIINASSVEKDGIVFRSKAEERMYELLLSSGLSFKYEPLPYILFKGFYPNVWYKGQTIHKEKVRDITYTPDFVVRGKARNYIIEVKGFPNDVYPVKRKLLFAHLRITGDVFFEVYKVRDMRFCIDKIKELEKHELSEQNQGTS